MSRVKHIFVALTQHSAKLLSEVTNLSLEDNAQYLKASSQGEIIKQPIQFKSRYGDAKGAELCMSAIHDQEKPQSWFFCCAYFRSLDR